MWDRYMWTGLPAKLEASLRVDQQGMRASVSNKTSRCNIHTSATGWLCWEGKAKVTYWSCSQETSSLYTPVELRVYVCKHILLTHTHTPHTGPCMYQCFYCTSLILHNR